MASSVFKTGHLARHVEGKRDEEKSLDAIATGSPTKGAGVVFALSMITNRGLRVRSLTEPVLYLIQTIQDLSLAPATADGIPTWCPI